MQEVVFADKKLYTALRVLRESPRLHMQRRKLTPQCPKCVNHVMIHHLAGMTPVGKLQSMAESKPNRLAGWQIGSFDSLPLSQGQQPATRAAPPTHKKKTVFKIARRPSRSGFFPCPLPIFFPCSKPGLYMPTAMLLSHTHTTDSHEKSRLPQDTRSPRPQAVFSPSFVLGEESCCVIRTAKHSSSCSFFFFRANFEGSGGNFNREMQPEECIKSL